MEGNELNKEETSEITETGKTEWVSKLRYSRSFTAKLILSDDKIKQFFADLANALLSYDKTRASRSRTGESFFYGRKQFARLAYSGKTLCLYLSVDPEEYCKGKYKFRDVSHKKKYAAVPAKLKVKSAGACKYALSVIKKVFDERYSPRKKPIDPVLASDYPFEPFESLLARDLIRVILPKTPAVPPAETPPEDAIVSPSRPAVWLDKLRYSRSFLAKLIMSDVKVKEFYAELATKLLSYDKVKSRLSWSGIGFSHGKTPVAKINFSGKTLCLYLAVDPSAYKKGRYSFTDAGKVKKYAQVPAKIKLKSGRAVAFAIEVIEKLAAEKDFSLREPALMPILAKNFPYDTFDNLLARGLIRLIRTTKKELNRSAKVENVYGQDENGKPVLGEGGEKVGEVVTGKEGEGEGEQKQVGDVIAGKEGGQEGGTSDREIAEVVVVGREVSDDEEGVNMVRTLSKESYEDTLLTNKELMTRHREYDIILGFLKSKTADIKLVKRYVVKTIDEKWISAIEDSLDALDDCLRKPTHFIEETEELLPIERTKKVTPRSIRHLCEHTDLIAKATDDEIIPTHLLNVFRDDSMMTYENKFLNTLLHRLYVFVNDRYNQALRNGANERVSVLTVSENFTDGPIRGKMNFNLEISEPHGDNVRNSVKTKDLWRRVVKLRGIVGDYFKSELAVNLGNTFIRPPVIRTNAILKNPNLRECLTLWEFIESYEDEGNGITTEEYEEKLSDEHIEMIYQGLAEQYLVLRYNTTEAGEVAFVGGPQLDYGVPEQSEEKTVFGAKKTQFVEPEESDESVLFAVEAAVAADLYIDQLSEEERKQRKKEREELLETAKEEEKPIVKEEETEDIPVSPVEELPVGDLPKEEKEEPAEEEKEDVEDEKEDEKEEEKEETEEVVTSSLGITVRYKKSLEAKLRLSSEDTKQYYCDIYNAFLSKDKVRVREGYSSVTFQQGRRTLAKMTVVGRTLRVYFALDPSALTDRYRVKDCSEIKKFALTPSMMKVRSPRGLKQALALVDLVCEGLGENSGEFTRVEASRYVSETIERLVEMGLAQKVVTEKPSFAPVSTTAEEKPTAESGEKAANKPAEEVKTEETKPAVDLSGAGGDALIPQKEAMSDKEVKLSLENKEEEQQQPVRVEVTTEPAGGDALGVKPTTLAELLAYERGETPKQVVQQKPEEEPKPESQPEKKESLWVRLFKRRK